MKKVKTISFNTRRIVSRHLYTKGCGVFGALGHGDDLLDSSTFKRLDFSGSANCEIKAKHVCAGWGHSAVVTTTGHLLIFGRPYDDITIKTINRIKTISPAVARFYGKFSSNYGGHDEISYGTPQFVDGMDDVVSAHCSVGFTACMTKSGDLYSMGQDKWGQCGIGSRTKEHVYEPTKVSLDFVKAIDVGLSHCIALSECGSKISTWGRGLEGQLGVGSTRNSYDPLRVNIKGTFVKVSAGFYHSAAVTSEGVLYVWGKGMASVLKREVKQSGSTATRFFEDQLSPRVVRIPGSRRAVDICSSNFTLVIRCCDGSLWALGVGEYDKSSECIPLRVQQGVKEGSFINSGDGDGGGSGDGFYNISTRNPSRFPKKAVEKTESKKDPKNDILNNKLNTHFLQTLVQSEHTQGGEDRSQGRGQVGRSADHGDVALKMTLPPAILPPKAAMRKGFQRVTILCAKPDGLLTSCGDRTPPQISTSNTADASLGGVEVYEVVIHGGEAFLKNKHVPITGLCGEDSTVPLIDDYSTGWQHSMLTLK